MSSERKGSALCLARIMEMRGSHGGTPHHVSLRGGGEICDSDSVTEERKNRYANQSEIE